MNDKKNVQNKIPIVQKIEACRKSRAAQVGLAHRQLDYTNVRVSILLDLLHTTHTALASCNTLGELWRTNEGRAKKKCIRGIEIGWVGMMETDGVLNGCAHGRGIL